MTEMAGAVDVHKKVGGLGSFEAVCLSRYGVVRRYTYDAHLARCTPPPRLASRTSSKVESSGQNRQSWYRGAADTCNGH